jgi:hypothetical protein
VPWSCTQAMLLYLPRSMARMVVAAAVFGIMCRHDAQPSTGKQGEHYEH